VNIKYLISKAIKKIHIPAVRDSIVDKTSKVCSGSHLINVKVGRYTYIGNYCTVIDAQIDNFCSIADNCAIGGASHPLDWVSSSPVFHSGKNILRKNFANHQHVTTQRTNIGSDVWIGSNCLIKSGVKIGTGSVIGMGSILTKDVGEYEIWAGNPAHIIGSINGETARVIEESQCGLCCNAEDFDSLSYLILRFCKSESKVQMVKNAQKYYFENYDKDQFIKKLEKSLLALCEINSACLLAEGKIGKAN